ncbi:hypothetical protein WH47_05887 [Habropoda laboriosa]|uniref:Omega-conotoxin-like protein 1 n=1 Tax=Habropoda laboriosa TaxID=597456 RepID=A0A0L7QTM6_9HYME|nr:PREDICTED: omega-conotoxin-like protein 1 [Habropoda laboriosa]XP_017793716.1 PREDICTED: omega-conotoxin-like protein 1 [Habropoda laboriosa]KOC61998.1 hypothetical protein WH47_05887 [Habropoda laboriosa]
MSKLMLFLCVVLLASSLIDAAPELCGRYGDPCTSSQQCCGNMTCLQYANKCQVIITSEELMKQREKILGRKGKDY